ncbi:MAG: translation elongation factor Ts [Candidatus Magasanikbacteria bacterium]|nr:translation elongation factor Ts [Candidatus Magasanikbacteria bacterium]
MPISSGDIMKLRAQTGAGMMDCKNALEEAGGDMDKAGEILRKKGIVKAAKRADKIAAEGLIVIAKSPDLKAAVLVEVNSETDFVGASPDFKALAEAIAEAALENKAESVEAALGAKLASGKTVSEAMSEMSLKVGEKIGVRRAVLVTASSGIVASYIHGTKIGVLVELEGGAADFGADVAMHVAASNPKYLNREGADQTDINKEKEIYAEQLRAQKKPENIIENIVKGKIDKYFGEVCLLEQPFIKDEETTVGKLAEKNSAKIIRFIRMELGEGIEKKQTDFAAEVKAQLK